MGGKKEALFLMIFLLCIVLDIVVYVLLPRLQIKNKQLILKKGNWSDLLESAKCCNVNSMDAG